MQKNVAGQKVQLFAFDITTGDPKAADAANITAYVTKDHGTVTVLGDTSATEMDATNAKGLYVFDLTQGETNADELTFSAKSSTANIRITPRFFTATPPNWSLESIDSGGVVKANLAQILGTVLTETAGLLAAGFKKWFNVASPTGTLNSIPDAVPGQAGALLIAGSNLSTTFSLLTISGAFTFNGTSLTTVLAAIQADTDDIQTRLPAALVAGRMDVSIGAVAAGVIVGASFGATTELAAVPLSTANPLDQLQWLFMELRNKTITDKTGGTTKIHNNAGAAIGTSTVTDDGTTFTKNKFA